MSKKALDKHSIFNLITEDLPFDSSTLTDEESDDDNEPVGNRQFDNDIDRLLFDLGSEPDQVEDDCESFTVNAHIIDEEMEPEVDVCSDISERDSHTGNENPSGPDYENPVPLTSNGTKKPAKKLVKKKPSKKENAETKKIENEKKWSKHRIETERPEFQGYATQFEDNFANCSKATDFFLTFLTDDIRDEIIFQSNLYANQIGKPLNLKKEELLIFLAINLLMGYHKLPSWRDFWKCDPDLHVDLVAKSMSRNRFGDILSRLHLNDNQLIPKNNTNKLYKLRHFTDALNEQFGNLYNPGQNLSVDESMILFNGRSSLKQYNPLKPIKRGYKIWCLGDMQGYILKFDIYQGKFDSETDVQQTYGLGGRVVFSLCNQLLGIGHVIYFDNFFTSVALMEKLGAENTGACGTVRCTRKLLPTMQGKKMKRGEFDYKVSENGLAYYKWMDNKEVFILSNFHGDEETTVARTEKNGQKIQVTCPVSVADYNTEMGGIDKADMLRSMYGLDKVEKMVASNFLGTLRYGPCKLVCNLLSAF